MNPIDKRRQADGENSLDQMQQVNTTIDAVEDDGTPVLDELDLEENNITEEESDDIRWDEP
jgi:hypothetical protein